eukprot:gene11294-12602_t
MALLFNLPPHLSISVLGEWVANHRDFSALDIACTSHQIISIYNGNGFIWKCHVRHELLHLFWNPLLVLRETISISPQKVVNYIEWLNMRQVGARALSIPVSKLKEIISIKAFSLPKLESVRFCDESKQHNIRLAEMKFFLSHCPSISHIDCSSWSHISDVQLAMLASEPNIIKLRKLSLSGCFMITDGGVSSIAPQFYSTLEELNLDCVAITDRTLQVLASSCKGLTRVSLSYCQSLSRTGIIGFCASLPALRSIALEDFHPSQVNDELIEKILSSNPLLQELGLDYCKGITMGILSKALQIQPLLSTLVTHHFEYRSNKASHNNSTRKCNSSVQRKLKLKGCFTRQNSILDMIEACPVDIHTLDAKECRKLGSFILRAIVNKFGDTLQVLEISPWVDVEDDAMLYALQQCPHLTGLSVDFCEALGDETLVAVSQYCPRLVSLSITKCPKVTDAGIINVLQNCPRLQTLDLTACHLLSDATLIKVAEHCFRLRRLNILNTSVSKEGVLRVMLENKLELHRFYVEKRFAPWINRQLAPLQEFGQRWRKRLVYINYFVDPTM